jgi:hemoglobin
MKIGSKWRATFRKMYRFWQTILFEEHTTRKPFPHKIITDWKEHFDRWMEIFIRQQTSYLPRTGKKKTHQEYGKMFNYKINYFKCWTKWRSL